MNTANAANLPMNAAAPTVRPVNQLRVTHSEWIKFSSLRSNWASLLIVAMSIVGLGVLASLLVNRRWSSMSAVDRANVDAIRISLSGVGLAQLIIAVLGVLVVTGEYSDGMIRASLAAVPKRFALLVGKLTISAAVSFVVALSSTFFALLIGQHLLGSHGEPLNALHALQMAAGTAYFLMSISVIASAIGFITRSTAGGIAAVVALLLVLPVMISLLPYGWATDILNYLPSSAGDVLSVTAITVSRPGADASTRSVGSAIITLAGWMCGSTGVAAVLFRRRDV